MPDEYRIVRWRRIVVAAAFSLVGCSAVTDPDAVRPALDAQSAESAGLPDTLLFGDLHVHTNMSFDSNSFGNVTLGPDDAYRFAAGEEVIASNGQSAKLARPLDFLMVADHAEYLGVLSSVRARDREIAETALGKRWIGFMDADANGIRNIVTDYVAMVTRQKPIDGEGAPFKETMWNRLVDAAERHNRPGVFTTFAGYEWTSMPGGLNMHRVVVFRDGESRTRRIVPFSAIDSDDPENLWDYLQRYEDKTGGQVLAIAHNGNLSGGLMFADKRLEGSPINAEYARRRTRWEPVYEVTQVKGDGEAHPLLSPDDSYADFETWYETDISLRPRSEDPAERRASIAGDYAREGLKKGLAYQARLGANPFHFGLMGSTDSHTALATADDDNFWGKFLDSEPGPERLGSKMGGALWDNSGLSASGYTGVWARANTRAEIFDALMRRETFATTGPRMRLRMFGGWDFAERDFRRGDFLEHSYANGVPMGGSLTGEDGGGAPRFLIRAMQDPDGARLDRVQVVKGWLAADGTTHEKVFDAAVAGPGGAPMFDLLWRDPAFDPSQHAFYYVRLLQVPTKRWTTYDAERYGLSLPAHLPRMIQERAYGSPIWYQPKAKLPK